MECQHCYCQFTTGMLWKCCKCGDVILPPVAVTPDSTFSWPDPPVWYPWNDPVYKGTFMYHERIACL